MSGKLRMQFYNVNYNKCGKITPVLPAVYIGGLDLLV